MAAVVVGMSRYGASVHALAWASHEAEVRGVPLTVLHAWDQPVELAVDIDGRSLPELRGPATARAVPGRAATVLLSEPAELLVLGGRPLDRHLSPLTRTLLQRARSPVVVLRGATSSHHRRVVAAVCNSEASRGALRWAAQEAALRRATLTVLHAWQVHPASPSELLHPARAVPQQRQANETRLSGWVHDTLGTQDLELVLTHGPPLEALLQISGTADLVVLGRREHSATERVLHAHVGDDVSGLATCPVVIVPHRTPAHAGDRSR